MKDLVRFFNLSFWKVMKFHTTLKFRRYVVELELRCRPVRAPVPGVADTMAERGDGRIEAQFGWTLCRGRGRAEPWRSVGAADPGLLAAAKGQPRALAGSRGALADLLLQPPLACGEPAADGAGAIAARALPTGNRVGLQRVAADEREV